MLCARLLGLVFSLSFSKLLKMFHKMLWRLLILQNSSCKLISNTMKLGPLVAGRICWVVSHAHRLRFLWWDPTKKGCFNERCNRIFLSFITFSTLNDPISLFLCQINQLKSFGVIRDHLESFKSWASVSFFGGVSDNFVWLAQVGAPYL